MGKYEYTGYITSFGKVVDPKWKGDTQAISTSKAHINLCFQAKKHMGLEPFAKVELDKSKIILKQGGE